MNNSSRFPQAKASSSPVQRLKGQQQNVSRVSPQRPVASQPRQPPVAPPVYRPQPVPKVLQGKMAVSHRPQATPTAHKHAAPPVYRPAPKPLHLQPAQQQAKAPVPAQAARHTPQPSTGQAGKVRPVIQHKQNPMPPAAARFPSRKTVIQPKWVDDGGNSFVWDQLVDGVRWHTDKKTGAMYYKIEDASMIKLGNVDAYKAHAGKGADRQTWLNQSVAGFDILAEHDASVVKPNQINEGVLDTATLGDPCLLSQFKDIYNYKDQLLAVFKDCNSSAVLNEVAMLKRIERAGFDTPNPKVIEVIHKGKKTMGILMDKITGIFVDMAKLSNPATISYILNEAAAGRKVDTSEYGVTMLRMKANEKWTPAPQSAIATLCEDLSKILKSAEKIVINDLQFMVKPDGRIVIIDPQWAGHRGLVVNQQEIGFIQATYHRVKTSLAELKAGGPQQSSSPMTGGVASRGGLSSRNMGMVSIRSSSSLNPGRISVLSAPSKKPTVATTSSSSAMSNASSSSSALNASSSSSMPNNDSSK